MPIALDQSSSTARNRVHDLKTECDAETVSPTFSGIGQVAHESVNSRMDSRSWIRDSEDTFPKRTGDDQGNKASGESNSATGPSGQPSQTGSGSTEPETEGLTFG